MEIKSRGGSGNVFWKKANYDCIVVGKFEEMIRGEIEIAESRLGEKG